jgi:hypothetical protein
MQVVDIDGIRAEFLQRLLNLGLQDLGLVRSRFMRVPLARDLEPLFLPSSLSGPRFLLATDVDARGVDLVVASGFQEVEASFVFVHRGDSGALVFIGAKGHETEDDSVFGSGRHDRCV